MTLCVDPTGSASGRWYAAAAWYTPFERDARRRHPAPIAVDLRLDRLIYTTTVEVPGRGQPVGVAAVFWADPGYPTYGLQPGDYPQVWADPHLRSPHRMPNGSLCLFDPHDPPDRRWHSGLGLLSLLDLTRDHLFFEQWWRLSGAADRGQWLGPQAPHGAPR